MRIVIIGSGPTALGALHRLYETGALRNGTQVIVLEQSSGPGGLSISERDNNGFLWDMGGHVVFSHYYYFDDVLNKIVPEWNERSRSSFAFMKDSDEKRRFIPYPVQNNVDLFAQDDQDAAVAGLEQLASSDRKKPEDFSEWLTMNFGQGLCEIFMTKYNRKVWTVDPTEMNAAWVGERVAIPDVDAIKRKITLKEQQGDDVEIKDSGWGPNRNFRFPKYGGTGSIWTGIFNTLPRQWFNFGQRVVGVNTSTKTLIVEASSKDVDEIQEEGPTGSDLEGTEEPVKYNLTYDHLISTIPLDRLLESITPSSVEESSITELSREFVHSTTHVVGIGLKGQPPDFLKEKTWIYIPDSDSPFYRITVFSNYSDDHTPDPSQYWSLMCECAEPADSSKNPAVDCLETWDRDSVIDKTIAALVEYRFIDDGDICSKYHRRLDYGYPVPFKTREDVLSKVQPWLESKNIYSRGRFGGWRYEVANQDHSFMQGVEIADRIVFGIPEETYSDPIRVNSAKRNGRLMPLLLGIKIVPDREFVIAHYNEDLSWIQPFADYCHVYHKGNEKVPRFDVRWWEQLPNYGREAHTYLYHIIENYHRLADVTVFLQGSIDDHQKLGHCYGHPLDYVNEAMKHQLATSHRWMYNNWGRIKHTGKYLTEFRTRSLRPARGTFAEFWNDIFGIPHPPTVTMNYGACFAVTRARIHKHPLDFYTKIFNYLNDHRNPEEGHYMERLWLTIFS